MEEISKVDAISALNQAARLSKTEHGIVKWFNNEKGMGSSNAKMVQEMFSFITRR